MGETGPQHEHKTPELIVEEILAGKRELSPDQITAITQMVDTKNGKQMDEDERPRYYLLEYGGKYLMISFRQDRDEIGTYIKNNGQAKKPQETTLLYTAAKKMMQQHADDSGRRWMYILVTTSPVMKKWAVENGSQIFHWDPEPGFTQQMPEATKYWFTRTFSPQKDGEGEV